MFIRVVSAHGCRSRSAAVGTYYSRSESARLNRDDFGRIFRGNGQA